MEYKDVLDTMTGEYNNLTKSGRKAADYIFAHRVEAQYMSITALAEECGVAEATISRFCRTLGFSGYNDFKLALAKASGAPAADDEVGIYGKVLPGGQHYRHVQKAVCHERGRPLARRWRRSTRRMWAGQ